MLMRNFSCCGARCIVRASACMRRRASCAALTARHPAPRQLPEDEDDLASVMSRGDIRRLARDASALLGQGDADEAPGSEMKPMGAPRRPRFEEEDEEG